MQKHFTFEKNGIHWWVFENTEFGKSLVCACAYKKGAETVTRLLNFMHETLQGGENVINIRQ